MNHALRTHDRGMSTANTSRMCVELETGADPIRGSIERSDGTRQPFWGWLELIEALRRAAADPRERNASPLTADARGASCSHKHPEEDS